MKHAVLAVVLFSLAALGQKQPSASEISLSQSTTVNDILPARPATEGLDISSLTTTLPITGQKQSLPLAISGVAALDPATYVVTAEGSDTTLPVTVWKYLNIVVDDFPSAGSNVAVLPLPELIKLVRLRSIIRDDAKLLLHYRDADGSIRPLRPELLKLGCESATPR